MLRTTPVLQMCKADLANWCVPYTINCRNITRTTNTPITRTPTGLVSNAIIPRKDMSKMEETSAQKVGMREDREKKTCESYTSWERCYGTKNQIVRRMGLDGYVQWTSLSPPSYNGAETRRHRQFQDHMQRYWWQPRYKRRSRSWRSHLKSS